MSTVSQSLRLWAEELCQLDEERSLKRLRYHDRSDCAGAHAQLAHERESNRSYYRDALLRCLAQILDKPLHDLRFQLPGLTLSETEHALWHKAYERLRQDEPLAYILGEADFADLTFLVGPGVLIPRPDSEVIVWQAARSLHKYQLIQQGRSLVVYDLCCGTACLGLALWACLKRYDPNCQVQVYAVDIEEKALVWAEKNVAYHQAEKDFKLVQADLLPAIGTCPPADIVLCNPPYIPERTWRQLESSVKDYEPQSALIAAEEGLQFYSRLASELPPYLSTNGILLVEHGEKQQADVKQIFLQQNWELVQTLEDMAGRERALQCLWPKEAY